MSWCAETRSPAWQPAWMPMMAWRANSASKP